ncbi:DNA topoisomerase 2 [Martiniozyma asiatica (nom. inval.)]|nr:DNA topoisomerase 2 [Martiniozyma asiatica]
MSDSDSEFSMDESPKVRKTGKKSSASSQYQKLSQLEHILKRPDTYIGSVEKYESEQWIYNVESESMEKKTVTIVPGLFKIFDEILVNAADNKIRDPNMKRIDVKFDVEANVISVKNDGKGIPIEIHDKEKIYIPELIFGNLLTSSNYDDDEKKVTGGRNGYGAKLCNIFSTEFTVNTADVNSGKQYTQIWTDNMTKVNKPRMVSYKKKTEFTEIIFKPDLAKFGMEKLDDDILGVLRRRVYDICGSVRGVNVYLNDAPLKVKNFKQYVALYVKALDKAKDERGFVIKSEEDSEKSTPVPESSGKLPTIVHEIINDRWEIAFSLSDGNFQQVSFVNSIATTSGGTHVDMVSNLIVKEIMEAIKKKNKRAIIKPVQIKTNMFLFINCLVENPAFTSQTKEQLTTRPSQFGGKKLQLPDGFVKKILNSGILDQVLDIAAANADRALKKNDGSRKNRITGYPKLEDANKAGTKEGHKCTLILTEGDSAAALAVAGLAVVGRNYYGCYPLRGKMLNVREASADQIMKNQEIQAIKQIMGLQHKKQYNLQNLNSLRYGRIMIMADQDHDGSHIKGLIINFLEISFPGLLEVPNFLIEFITPIIKITIMSGPNRRKTLPFYTMPEYETWRDTEGTTCSYKQKYYKGLGTSSPQEMREYFSQLDKHLKKFNALREQDSECLDLAFSKKKTDARKDWLKGFQPGTFLDPNISDIPISDFINKELILFSMADNIRSIPSVMDGFKPAQRKILYGCYKRNLRDEIKVSQLEGYIAEHTGYHHGDASLMQSIIGLAQNFVGSNNLNILVPHGGFGSRAAGGKDAAAARYIFTELSPITRTIFNTLDNPLLNYLQDDEQTVEPEWYVPILPMLLVNGSEGIGSGWSTSIPPFNPTDIVKNIRHLMNDEEMEEMMPWFKGWEGVIKKDLNKDRYRMEGTIDETDANTLSITELPARMWTITMKEYLLNGLSGSDSQKPWIKDMEEDHGVGINFIVKLTNEEMEKSRKIGLLTRFKLSSTIAISNMVAFDPRGRIKKYANVNDILEDYYSVRLEYYQKRKDYLVDEYSNQLSKISSQARFVKMIIDKELVVSNKKKNDLIEELRKLEFPAFDKNSKTVNLSSYSIKNEDSSDNEDDAAADTQNEDTGLVVRHNTNISQYFEYLLGMAIWSLTRERYEKLLKQKEEKEELLNILLSKTPKMLWDEDLTIFMEQWEKFLIEDEENRLSMSGLSNDNKKGTKRKRAAPKTATKKSKSPAPKPVAKKPKTKKSDKEEAKSELMDLDSFDAAFAAFSKPVSAVKSSSKVSGSRKSSSKPKLVELSDNDEILFSDDSEDENIKVAPRTKSSRAASAKPSGKYSLDSEDDSFIDQEDSEFEL